MTKLSVNINKIATIRNARGHNNPDLVKVALDAERFGAQGITVHPRPDERHIRFDDVMALRDQVTTEFNIEGYPDKRYMEIIRLAKPAQATLVPDPPEAITSNTGWDTIKHREMLKDIISELHNYGVRTSIFINPESKYFEPAKATGTDRVELYTEPYASTYHKDKIKAVAPYMEVAAIARELNLGLNAGHDLDLHNLKFLKEQIPYLDEVSIGHALVCDALYYGLENTIQMYRRQLEEEKQTNMKLNFRKSGTGKPLVILHGLFGSADNWLSIAKSLEEKFTLYLLDQRNHGDSPHSDTWDYKAMAEDLKEFMDAESLEKASFLGHSMGGKTVMKFALTYPELVDKLVVADIAPRPYPVHHQTILEALNAVDIKGLGSRKEAEDTLAKYIPERGIRQFLLKNLTRKEGAFAWKANLPVITEKIENVGEEIAAVVPFSGPVLFMGGAHSDYIKSSDKEDIDALFPENRIIHIKNAGHWLHAEQPEAVVATINAFLGS